MEETKEEQAKSKAENLEKKHTLLAEATAERIEEWLMEHEGAPLDELHTFLVENIKATVTMAMLTIMLM